MLLYTNPIDEREKQLRSAQENMMTVTKACEAGNKEACLKARDIQMGNYQITAGQFADGGEVDMSLLGMPPEMEMDEEVTTPDLTALQEILGEAKFEELEEAMEMHPVVMEVAEMAVMTGDGEVSGMGGPKDDKVPARLSAGEFVFSAEAVQALGLDKLEELHNYGKQLAAST